MPIRDVNRDIPKALKWTQQCGGQEKGLAGNNKPRNHHQHADDTESHDPYNDDDPGLKCRQRRHLRFEPRETGKGSPGE